MNKFLLLSTLFSVALSAEETGQPTSPAPSLEESQPVALNQLAVDTSKISEAFGHLIGKNLEANGFKFDIAQVIKGLQDANSGKDAPMSETECFQAITAIQEEAFKQQSSDNLQKANEFLAKNTQEAGVVALESGKIQYKIEKEGEGAAVEEHDSPLLRYTGKYLDGTVFGASKEDELISLDETLPGFTKGILGMKEGEKRTLFIHPELGYGTSGYLPPNSLLTFEVEVLKANAAPAPVMDSLTTPTTKENPEIASPFEGQQALR